MTGDPQSGLTHADSQICLCHCGFENIISSFCYMPAENCQSNQSLVSLLEHRPKFDEILIYTGQGSLFCVYVSTAVIPDNV